MLDAVVAANVSLLGNETVAGLQAQVTALYALPDAVSSLISGIKGAVEMLSENFRKVCARTRVCVCGMGGQPGRRSAAALPSCDPSPPPPPPHTRTRRR